MLDQRLIQCYKVKRLFLFMQLAFCNIVSGLDFKMGFTSIVEIALFNNRRGMKIVPKISVGL